MKKILFTWYKDGIEHSRVEQGQGIDQNFIDGFVKLLREYGASGITYVRISKNSRRGKKPDIALYSVVPAMLYDKARWINTGEREYKRVANVVVSDIKAGAKFPYTVVWSHPAGAMSQEWWELSRDEILV